MSRHLRLIGLILLGLVAIPLAVYWRYTYLDRLVASLGTEESQEARLDLREIGVPAIPALIRGFRSSNSQVRYGAAQILAEMGRPALPHIMKALDSPDQQVQEAAYMALCSLSDPQVVPDMKELARHAEPNLRCAAANVLSQTKRPEALPTLMELLDDKSEQVRQAAVYGLLSLGPAALPAMERLLYHPDGKVREHVIRQIQQWSGERPEAQAEVNSLLLAALRRPEPEESCRVALLQALSNARCEAAREDCHRLILEDSSPEVRQTAFEVLRSLRDPEEAEWALKYLQRVEGEPSYSAILAVSQAQDRRAVPVLIRFVRRGLAVSGCMQALDQIGDPAAVPVLLDVATGNFPDPPEPATPGRPQEDAARRFQRRMEVQKSAIRALGKFRDPPALQRMVPVLRRLIRQGLAVSECVSTLGQTGDPSAVPVLLEVAAGKFPDPPELALPENLKGDTKYLAQMRLETRRRAMQALGEIGDPQALPALKAAAADPQLKPYAESAQQRIKWAEERRAAAKKPVTGVGGER